MLNVRRSVSVTGRMTRIERNSIGVSRMYMNFGTPGGKKMPLK